MATLVFTQNLARHVATPTREVRGTTVREVLAEAFATEPKLAGYLLDDQGALRKHVVVFVDGVQTSDRTKQGDAVHQGSEVCVMQALSGG